MAETYTQTLQFGRYTVVIGQEATGVQRLTILVDYQAGGGGAGQPPNGTLDTSIAAPILALAVPANTYPPQIDVDLSDPQIQSGSIYTLRFLGSLSYTFGTNFLNANYTISDAEANAHQKLVGTDLSSITSPQVSFFKARVEWMVGGNLHFTNWSNIQGHGDVTAPSITSSTSQNTAELAPVLQTITASEVVNFAISGTDAASIELVGAQPANTINYRLTGNAIPDYETKNSYVFGVTPTDLSGNVGSTATITLTINDVDELADTFTFTDLTNQPVSTLCTSNLITVSGLAGGVAAPIAISGGGGQYSKNGGAYTSANGTVVNGDTFRVQVTSASTADGSTVSTTVTIGDVPVNQVSDTFSVSTVSSLTPPPGSVLYLDASDLTTLFQSNAGTTAVVNPGDVVGYWGDKSGNGNNLTSVADDTTRPTLQQNSGKNVIRFDGSNDFLRILSNLGTYAAGGCTVGISIKSSPAANAALVSFGNTGNNNNIYNPVMSDSGTANRLGARVVTSTGTSLLTNNTNIASGTFDGTAKTLMVTDSGAAFTAFLNNVQSSDGPDAYTRSGTVTENIMGLGAYARATPTAFFAADIYAIVIYNSVLNSTDLTTLHNFLASKQ